MKGGQQNCYCLLESDLGEIIAAVETLPEIDQIILLDPTPKVPINSSQILIWRLMV